MTYNLERILSTDGLDKNGIKFLRDSGIEIVEKKFSKSELIKQLPNFDAIIIRSATTMDQEIIEAVNATENSKLKIIARAGTGVDNIDMEAASKCGLLVLNTPAANTISAAEHTFALMMCLSRNIPQAHITMQQGKWDRKSFMGTELYKKTLGIIGVGRIGREIALRAQAFGMKTIGYDPIVCKEEAALFNVELMNLNEMWPLADYITVHVPLLPETENLIDLEVLKKCKRGVKIINCSRGGIIKEDDLLIALNTELCSGAALDVFTEEPPTFRDLIKHPKLISTPHLGASTEEAQYRVSMEIAENLVSIAKSDTFKGLVNGQTLYMLEDKESLSWTLLLSIISECVNIHEKISLFYDGLTTFSKRRGFENFVKMSLATFLLKDSKNVNLINSLSVAKEGNIEISIVKKETTSILTVPSLSIEIKKQILEMSVLKNQVYLTKYNNKELRQPVFLTRKCTLLITTDSKSSFKLLGSKDVTVTSYVMDGSLHIFVTERFLNKDSLEGFDLIVSF